MMTQKPVAISAVIPALNEQETIAGVVKAVLNCELIDEVVVVNNDSTDATGALAAEAGAQVIDEPVAGQGNALRTGYIAARNDWVIKLDADLSTFSNDLIESLHSEIRPGIGLVKGLWHDSNDNMPMTRLMVRPAIEIMFPGLSHIQAVNSGIFLFNRSLIAVQELTAGYGADLDIMLRIHTAGWNVAEIDIGEIQHDPRNLQHYNRMAETLLQFMIERHEQAAQNSIVIVAKRAEEIIASCLGTITKKLRNGGRATAYLIEHDSESTRLLKSVLVKYPTFSIQPLHTVNKFSALAGRQQTTILTSYIDQIADSDDPLVKAALSVYQRYNKRDKKAMLLMMPLSQNLKAAVGFQPDVRVDVLQDIGLVRKTQQQLFDRNKAAAKMIYADGPVKNSWRGEYSPESIEAYQAFDHKDIPPPLVTL